MALVLAMGSARNPARKMVRQLTRKLAIVVAMAAATGAVFGPTETAAAQEDFSHEALAEADYFAGKRSFTQRCGACHTLADGGKNLVGPNLYGIFARPAGGSPGFAYSDALTESGRVWTPGELAAFLSDPEGYLPGIKMMIPEAVPVADQPALVSFLMVETGAADWPRPEPAADDAAMDPSLPVAERFPSFWNHMMFNTTRYRLVTEQDELIFKAYFNPDGSVGSSDESIRGFWHVDERDFFCYALYGIPVAPEEFVECFPVAVMSIPRFAEELWASHPAPGVTLHGGIMAGRP
jgi:cytochrome c2